MRPIFGWLNIVFNQVDHLRLKEYGPDRVCAEWLLRNGASVQWVGEQKFLTNYNSLPSEGNKLFIEKVNATGSSISHYGFLHFRGCSYIDEIILQECIYLENEALRQLPFVKDSLKHLNVSRCENITDAGLAHLQNLKKLQTLELFNLQYVKDKAHILKLLRDSLPNCKITSDFENKTNQ